MREGVSKGMREGRMSGEEMWELKSRDFPVQVACISWLERKAAAALFGSTPESSYEEALDSLMKVLLTPSLLTPSSLTHPFTHLLTRSLTHSLTLPLTHSLTHPLTHPLTHSPTRSISLPFLSPSCPPPCCTG